jgi:hypothetical protein
MPGFPGGLKGGKSLSNPPEQVVAAADVTLPDCGVQKVHQAAVWAG